MILDTTFVIDVMSNDEKAVARLKELIGKGEPQLITSPTMFELFSGLARCNKKIEEKNKIMKILSGQTILSFDSNAAEIAGEIDGTLIRSGNRIEPIDSMIAGIALSKKDKVITRNIRDFSKIKGMDIETY